MLLQLLSIVLMGVASLAGPVPSADQIKINDTISEVVKGIEEAMKHLHSTPEPISMELEHTTALPALEGVTYTYRPHRESTVQPESADDTEFVSVSTPEPETETTAHPESTPVPEVESETTEPETVTESGPEGTMTTEEPGSDTTSAPEDETTEGGVINVSVVIGATDATTERTPVPEVDPETKEPEIETVTDSESNDTTDEPESESTSAPDDDTTGEPETDVSGAPEDPETEEPETGTVTDSEPDDTTAPPESTAGPEADPETETEEPETDVTDGPEEPETEEPEGESTTESGSDVTEEPAIEPTTEPEVEQPETTDEPETEDPEDPTTEPTPEPEVEQPETTGEPETETTTDLTVPAEARVAGIPRSAAPEEAWEDLHRRIDPTSPYNLYNEKYYAIIEQWAVDWNMTEHDDDVRDYIWTRYRIQNEVATRVIEALDGLKDYFGEYAKLAEQQDYDGETSDTYFGPSTYLNEYERPIADEILRHFTDLALRAHGIE